MTNEPKNASTSLFPLSRREHTQVLAMGGLPVVFFAILSSLSLLGPDDDLPVALMLSLCPIFCLVGIAQAFHAISRDRASQASTQDELGDG